VATLFVDLTDLEGVDAPVPHAIDRWVTGVAAPWLRTHRRGVAVVVTGALAVVCAGSWWAARPEPPGPPPAVTVEDAAVVGSDVRGPHVDRSGHLSVAYSVRAAPGLVSVDVIGLRGPGILAGGVTEGADTLTGGDRAFVQLAADVSCSDRAIVTATPSSYGLLVRTTGPGGTTGSDTFVPFGGSTVALDVAVRDACLSTELPARVSVLSASISDRPGSSIAPLELTVRNEAEVPLTVSTVRAPSTAVETDLSAPVLLAPHSTGTVSTRLLEHDCAGPGRAAALSELPSARPGGGSSAPDDQAGVTVRVGLGTGWTIVSYALPWTVGELSDRLAATACAGHPTVTGRLVDVHGTRTTDRRWVVTARYDVRTTGVGIALGREHFTGPPDGDGSLLTTVDSLVPGVRWAVTPTRWDGGAGVLPVTFNGTTCDDRDLGVPTSMGVWVTTADRSVYPFELPLDPAVLARAADEACAPDAVAASP
jgi:hypothetical protein